MTAGSKVATSERAIDVIDVSAHWGLIQYQMRRIRLPETAMLNREDMMAECMLAVVKAARSYDARKGQFSTWAVRPIRWAIQHVLDYHDHNLRLDGWKAAKEGRARGSNDPPRMASIISLNQTWDDGDEERPRREPAVPDRAPWVCDHVVLRDALTTLPARQRTVLRCLYWEGLTLTETGRHLGVSRERVGQVRDKALAALRDALSEPAWTLNGAHDAHDTAE